ncbi:LysM peptidoglycan-binding domain-containing protein, partial [Actinomycetospora chlora]|uniref:LysM peptidoglycan-binding domain-containing protein n=1 Tax=Actinomycetospora chlora TaxID=663608 RepID=UPI0031E54782
PGVAGGRELGAGGRERLTRRLAAWRSGLPSGEPLRAELAATAALLRGVPSVAVWRRHLAVQGVPRGAVPALTVRVLAPGREPVDPVTGLPVTATGTRRDGRLVVDVVPGNAAGLVVVVDQVLRPAADPEARAAAVESLLAGETLPPRVRVGLAYLAERHPDALLAVLDQADRLRPALPAYADALAHAVLATAELKVAEQSRGQPRAWLPDLVPDHRDPAARAYATGVDTREPGGRRREARAVLQAVGVRVLGAVPFMPVARYGQVTPVLVVRVTDTDGTTHAVVGRPDLEAAATTLTVKTALSLGIGPDDLVVDADDPTLSRLRRPLEVRLVGDDTPVRLPGVRVQADLRHSRWGRDLLGGWAGDGELVLRIADDGRRGTLARRAERTPAGAVGARRHATVALYGVPARGGALAASLRARVTVVDGPRRTRGVRAVLNPRSSETTLSAELAEQLGLLPHLVEDTARGIRRSDRVTLAIRVAGVDVERRLEHVRVEDDLPHALVLGRDLAALLDEVTITRDRLGLLAPRTPDHAHDGPLALPGPTPYPTPLVAAALSALADRTRPLDPAVLPWDARGPPVRTVPADVLRAELERRGLAADRAREVVDRTLAFTAGGVVVVPAERAAAVAARHDEPAVAAWWRDVLTHERHHADGTPFPAATTPTPATSPGAGCTSPLFRGRGGLRGRDRPRPRHPPHDPGGTIMTSTTSRTPDLAAVMRRAVGLAVAVTLGAALLLGLLGGALGESAPAAAPAPAPVATAPSPAPAPSAVPAPVPAVGYTVVAGDTLAGIATQTGVPVELLAADNGLSDPDRITPGEVLTVPAPPSDVVVIADGATLTGYAQQHGTTVDHLLELNPQIHDADRILAGDGLRIATS